MRTIITPYDVCVLFMAHTWRRQSFIDYCCSRFLSPKYGHVAISFTPLGVEDCYVFDWSRRHDSGIGMTPFRVWRRYWRPAIIVPLGHRPLVSIDLGRMRFGLFGFNCTAFVSFTLGHKRLCFTPDELFRRLAASIGKES